MYGGLRKSNLETQLIRLTAGQMLFPQNNQEKEQRNNRVILG